MTENLSKKETNGLYFRRMLRGFIMLLLMTAMIFIVAGRLSYWEGWVYSGTALIVLIISFGLFVHKADLIEERVRPGPGTKWWDKIFFAFYIPMFLAIFIVASLDAGRFRWAATLPASVYILSYILHVFSYFLTLWAMWVNRFFSSRVRIQTDRGQVVVQDGPYRFVRHPGYVGGILMAATTSLVLGSLWGLIPAGVVVIMLVIRTYLEDITLERELSGYADYVKKVRYRLLPGIW